MGSSTSTEYVWANEADAQGEAAQAEELNPWMKLFPGELGVPGWGYPTGAGWSLPKGYGPNPWYWGLYTTDSTNPAYNWVANHMDLARAALAQRIEPLVFVAAAAAGYATVRAFK